ncbi:MAG: hypothetical protein NPIRA04_24600 [Nitrospirales bacterium]|nr:MAG: hypothetical protein NPIRA04_24600 [Nitrospirales bacterium]
MFVTPSPKSQVQPVAAPLEVFAKVTSNGVVFLTATKLADSTEAVGAGGGEVTVIGIVLSFDPPGAVMVNFTE